MTSHVFTGNVELSKKLDYNVCTVRYSSCDKTNDMVCVCVCVCACVCV